VWALPCEAASLALVNCRALGVNATRKHAPLERFARHGAPLRRGSENPHGNARGDSTCSLTQKEDAASPGKPWAAKMADKPRATTARTPAKDMARRQKSAAPDSTGKQQRSILGFFSKAAPAFAASARPTLSVSAPRHGPSADPTEKTQITIQTRASSPVPTVVTRFSPTVSSASAVN
jgi:hypothetical protein